MAFEHLTWASKTDVGHKRKNNEDSHVCLPNHGVFCVADGMGGMAAGDMASSMIVTTLREQIEAEKTSDASQAAAAKASRAISALRLANDRIRMEAKNRGLRSVGSTVVLVAFDGKDPSRVVIVHAGDSRCYRFRNNELLQLTTDHSVAEAVGVDEKKLSAMFRGVVTRAIGTMEEIDPERTNMEVQAGDLYLINSDGLTRMVTDEEIVQILARTANESLQQRADALVAAANNNGGDDNCTVVLVSVAQWTPPTGETATGTGTETDTAVDGDTSTSTSPGDEDSETQDEITPPPPPARSSAAATESGTTQPPAETVTPPPAEAGASGAATKILPQSAGHENALPEEDGAHRRKPGNILPRIIAIVAACAIGGVFVLWQLSKKTEPSGASIEATNDTSRSPDVPQQATIPPAVTPAVATVAAGPVESSAAHVVVPAADVSTIAQREPVAVADAKTNTPAIAAPVPAAPTAAPPKFILVDGGRNFAIILPGPPPLTRVPAKDGMWDLVKNNRAAFEEWQKNTPAAAEL